MLDHQRRQVLNRALRIALGVSAMFVAGDASAQAIYTTTTAPTYNGSRTVTTGSNGSTIVTETTKDYAGNARVTTTYTPGQRSQGYTGMGSGYRPMGR